VEGLVRHCDERKKWSDLGKRKEFFKRKNYVCKKCLKQHSYEDLEVEHDYPAVLGGKRIQCICKECHRPKTKIDIFIINFFKKMGFIATTRYETFFYIPKKEIEKLYYNIRKFG
jgi:hypothetical protein